ncbi:titin-like isoform X2 [Gadus macrocephalus]|uniref:titin-like isoform X2 n=1 Tax=Gadus macrocephalus TaxID=80720 RepID=UPI0028CB1D64|nr:titin-like isoform X2 [Gadus macrocephalus]
MSTQAPTFTQPLQSVVALEGSAATFEAQVTGSPVPEVSWFRDGQVLSAAALPGIQISFSDGRAVLRIPAVTATHSGRFSVRATNGAGQATSTAELLVTAETAPPNFVQRLQSLTVRQGSQVRLDVRVTGIPTPVVKFYREGAEIQSSPDFTIVQEADLYSLLIAEAFPEDSGTYSVNAANSSGRSTSTAELLVQGEEAVPAKKTKTVISTSQMSQSRQTRVEKRAGAGFQTTTMTEMQVEGGGMTQHLAHKTPPRVPPKPTSKSPTPPSLVARVAGGRHQSPSPVRHVKAPTPTPGRPVKSPLTNRKQMASGADVLPPWKQAGFMSEASYTSMTSTSTQLRTSSTQMQMEQHWEQQVMAVKEGEGVGRVGAVATVMAAVDLARVRQPVHVEQSGAEEEPVALQLQAAAPHVSLDLNVPLSQIQRTTETSSQVEAGLTPSPLPKFTVSKVTVPKHDSSYEVSRAGSAISSLQKDLSSHSTTRMIIKPVKSPSSSCRVVETRVTTEPSLFRDVVYTGSMEGMYEDWEALGKETEGAAVPTPTESVVPPTLLAGLKNLTVTEGESVSLECQITANPSPIIMWFREDYKIESSIDFQISYENGFARLVIREAFAEDSGRFTCTATSEAGTVSTSCYLLVQVSEEIESREEMVAISEQVHISQVTEVSREETMSEISITESDTSAAIAPFFIKKPSVQKLVEGGSVVFECQVGGSPKPHIIWKKSGLPLTTGYRYKVAYKKETGECRLEISMTFADDAGEYSIFAKNQLGEASASATLMDEEEYEAFMKKLEATFTTQVTSMVLEPSVGDVAPGVMSSQRTTTITSGQVSPLSSVRQIET